MCRSASQAVLTEPIDTQRSIHYHHTMYIDPHNNPEWEALCRQCGRCCFEKYENDNGAIFYSQTPCRYLDIISRECRIYDRRFKINPECVKLTPELVRNLKWLHPACGYYQALRNSAD